MTKELWINLPVKDVKKAKEFFAYIGFSLSTQYGDGIIIGSKKIVVMLFEESVFKGFTQNKLTDTKQSSEVLFSFDAESREEVDAMAKKVKAAGGALYSEPAENQGWMYGCAFTDLDGHRWNILYMDMGKMPKPS
jgi:predicted lactoylglutathione lyase